MSTDDQHYTYSEPSNEDRELLLKHGYRPGELPAKDEHDLVVDLREQESGDEDSDRLSNDKIADEQDGT